MFTDLLFTIKMWTYLLSLLSAISGFHECAHLHPLQLQQYQYYSAGLLSTHDPYYEQQRHLLGPKKKKFKEEKKLKGKVTNLVFSNDCCGLSSFPVLFVLNKRKCSKPLNFAWKANSQFCQRKIIRKYCALLSDL